MGSVPEPCSVVCHTLPSVGMPLIHATGTVFRRQTCAVEVCISYIVLSCTSIDNSPLFSGLAGIAYGQVEPASRGECVMKAMCCMTANMRKRYQLFFGCIMYLLPEAAVIYAQSAGPQLSASSANANGFHVSDSRQQRVLRAVHIQHLCAPRPQWRVHSCQPAPAPRPHIIWPLVSGDKEPACCWERQCPGASSIPASLSLAVSTGSS
jgi:hypothetical protein